jgi:hypothetical protein
MIETLGTYVAVPFNFLSVKEFLTGIAFPPQRLFFLRF